MKIMKICDKTILRSIYTHIYQSLKKNTNSLNIDARSYLNPFKVMVTAYRNT